MAKTICPMIDASNSRRMMLRNAVLKGPVLPWEGLCTLGEGLHVAAGRITWVDIVERRLYRHEVGGEFAFDLPVTATLVLADSGMDLLVVSGEGIGLVDAYTGAYVLQEDYSELFCADSHRTNDGCELGDGSYLVGTMHKTDPGRHCGAVYRISPGGDASLLFDDIHIPNTFIELSNTNVLISDSHTGTIFECRLRSSKGGCDRSVWYQARGGVAPDGGCRLSDSYVAIAMWNGASIRVFESSGLPVADLVIPAKRPTNAKYDTDQRLLWVTSASEELDGQDLEHFPLSGKTFCINDPLAIICS